MPFPGLLVFSIRCTLLRHSAQSFSPVVSRFASSFKDSDYAHAFEAMLDAPNVLHLSVDSEESIEQGKLIPRIDLKHIGAASVLGRREKNEDRLLACQLSPNHLLFGVFDGHGGSAAAEFARSVLPECIRYGLAALQNTVRKRGQSLRTTDLALFEPVMEHAFLQVNNLMMRHFYHYATARERLWAGTTATVVLLLNSHQVVVGHVGDSRALFSRHGSITALTTNHDPNSTVLLNDICKDDDGRGMTEVARIKKCGGQVITNSLGVPVVNGRLGMTRSLGDSQLKPFGVTAKPQLTSMKVRHGSASFLALVSDGVTYVMSDEEIQSTIASCRTPRDAAECVVENALLFGSDDNASALVIPFGSWGKNWMVRGRSQRATISPLRVAFAHL